MKLFFPLTRALIVPAVLAMGGCGEKAKPLLEIGGPTMGTYYSVKVVDPPKGITQEALRQGVERTLAQVISLISTYAPSSQLSQLNRNPSTDWIPVPRDLLDLIEQAQRLSSLSDGAFDVTVGPLVNLWGFGPEPGKGEVPSKAAIDAALARVGFRKLQLRDDPPAVRKERGDIYIDLSAIGEGYGADRIDAYLDSLGVRNYMAAVAGAIRVKGSNARGEPWAIAIEEPVAGERAVHRVVRLTDMGLSTSGDYRNFFDKNGRRYSHEIDPHTGFPVTHHLGSVTVVSDTATWADGLATALMVLGEDKGPALAQARGLAAYFIIHETGGGFSDRHTAAFAPYLAP